MRKTLIFTIVLVIAVAFASTLYFSKLTTDSKQNNKVLAFIPADASIVASFRYDESFLEIFKNYQPFNAIIGEDKHIEIDQIYKTFLTQPQLRQAMEDQNIFLSFHPDVNSTELLWVIALHNTKKEDINQILKTIQGITVKNSSAGLVELGLKSISRTLYLYINDGVVLGSFKKTIILDCINSNKTKISTQFIAEISKGSKKNTNSPFNLFINHHTLSKFTTTFFRRKLNGNFNFLKDLGGFSTLSMNFKSDALMFNGISSTDTSSKSYLNLFLHQKPINNTIKKVLPINTANFLAFGISNNKTFNTDLRTLFSKRGELKRLEQQLQKIKSETGVNFELNIKPLWGKEFASVQLASGENLAIIQVLNGQKLGFFLETISQEYASAIRKINYPNILYYYFGDPLNSFPRPLYTIIDNYLVVANTASVLQQFLTDYKADKLLNKKQEFLEFNQLVANQSNIFYFAHNENSQQIIKTKLQKSYAEAFTTKSHGLTNFYGLSLQWSSQGTHFFTNLYASYTVPKSEASEILWQFKMNGAVTLAPQVVINSNGEPFLLVQDKINRLYAISTEGKKLWSIQTDSKILGAIKQLDDRTLFFNTAQRLYKINPDGKNLTNFPVSLPQNASYSATIASSSPIDFNVFIPCNNSILAYNSSGNSLNGWPKTLDGEILFDVKTTALNNTNYVITGTENGKFYFFNQNGNLIKRVDDIAKRRFKNPLAIEIKTNIHDSRIITTDTTGAIRSVFFDGKMLQKSISTWTPLHFFDYKNISGDINPELIYLDKNQLYIYNTDSTLVYNYEFPYPIIQKPQFFTEDRSSYQIGIASEQDHLLYLFNSDGTLIKGFPFKGEPNFFVGNLKNDGKYYLICGGENNYLYAYKL